MKQMILAVLILGLVACGQKGGDEKATSVNGASEAVEVKSTAADAKSSAPAQAEKTTSFANAGPQRFIEGKHFMRLAKEVPKANPDKPEVAEVFWYGCIHCYHFEPIIEKWVKTAKPAGVEFLQIPAVWNERLNLHAKMYYATKQMGLLDKMHGKLFKAMNEENKKFATAEEIADFFAANGQDKQTFLNVINSFGVTSQAAAAGAKVQKYGIEGTPEVIVNGKFRTSARMADSQERMIEVIEYLLDKKD